MNHVPQSKLSGERWTTKSEIQTHKHSAAALACLILSLATAYGQFSDKRILTLDRIFSSSEFRSETFGPARWLDDGSAYTTLEPSPGKRDARDIIRYETATGVRSVLISADSLRPRCNCGAACD
jgi:dipeptidyl-peptidase-4